VCVGVCVCVCIKLITCINPTQGWRVTFDMIFLHHAQGFNNVVHLEQEAFFSCPI